MMEESPRSRRSVLDENADYKAQYINMDLAMHKISNGWEESPKLRRGMQMSLESHEEFEFTMSHNIAMKDDLYEPSMEVAPADELFFRGQLLPLQHDPRLQLVHTLSGIKGEHIEESVDFKSSIEEELAMKLAYEEAFPFAPTDEEGFHIHSAYQERLSIKCANEEGFDVPEGTSTITRSYRSDGVMDASKNDSRSSSFRSQQSSYWGSGEKDSRDSSSSSRCSNGSSQDAYFHGAERKAPHSNKAMANSHAHAHANANANARTKVAVSANDKAQHHAQHGKPPLPASKLKKWSWKTLFTGLRKASKIWIDDRGDEHSQSTSQRDMNKQKSKSVLGCTTTGQASRGMGMERDEYEGQISTNNHMGNVEMKKARQQASSSRGKGMANEEYGGHISSKYYMRNAPGWRGYNYYEGSNGGRPGKEKARMGIIAWNARESWQRWVKRPLYGKLSHTHKHTSIHEDIHTYNMKAKSLSSTPLAKSPARRADNVCHDADYVGAPSSSSKYINVGFAASCPASMRSSPHHSGVLAVVNKGPPASSLHDLHTAIQGAIAHCKQSQTAHPL